MKSSEPKTGGGAALSGAEASTLAERIEYSHLTQAGSYFCYEAPPLNMASDSNFDEVLSGLFCLPITQNRNMNSGIKNELTTTNSIIHVREDIQVFLLKVVTKIT